MSFWAGLVVGAVMAGLQVVAGHATLDYERLSVRGSGVLAVAVPAFLLPLAIAWGWTWVAERWSGRSGPRLLLFTIGLVLAATAAFPTDYLVYPPSDASIDAWRIADLAIFGAVFVLPVVAFAAALYWAFASGRVSAKLPTLALGYLAALSLALVLPTLAMGAVAGTAAGHAWRTPSARTAIAFLVVLVILVALYELPLAAGRAMPQFAAR